MSVARRYRFVLPAGWGYLAASESVEAAVARLVPDDGPTAGRAALAKLRPALRQQLRSLRGRTVASGGVDILLPVAPRAGAIIPANIVIARPGAEERSEYASGGLPTGWASAEGGADRSERRADLIGELPVTRHLRVRREQTDEAGTTADLIRVDYFIPVSPERERELALIVSATVLGRVGDERLPPSTVEVLVTLVDAIIHTFQWEEPPR